MQLGVVGLGRMGGNIVQRLQHHGHTCVVYDRNPDAVAALLIKSCDVFRAERAEITFLPTRERDAVVRTAVDKEQTTQFMTPVTLDEVELQFMSRLLLDSPVGPPVCRDNVGDGPGWRRRMNHT